MLQSLPNPALAGTLKSRVAPHKTPNLSTTYNPDSTYGTLRDVPDEHRWTEGHRIPGKVVIPSYAKPRN